MTAIGGGTIRGLIIGRTPLFYLIDPNYLLIGVIGPIATCSLPSFFKKKYSLFKLADSIGLATFLVIEVSLSYTHLFNSASSALSPAMTFIFLGMLTDFGSGIVRNSMLRDALSHLKNPATLYHRLLNRLFFIQLYFSMLD